MFKMLFDPREQRKEKIQAGNKPYNSLYTTAASIPFNYIKYTRHPILTRQQPNCTKFAGIYPNNSL